MQKSDTYTSFSREAYSNMKTVFQSVGFLIAQNELRPSRKSCHYFNGQYRTHTLYISYETLNSNKTSNSNNKKQAIILGIYFILQMSTFLM